MRHAQQPACSGSTDSPTEFLREHRGGEAETCCPAVELPLAEIRHVGQHRPQQRHSRRIRHLGQDIECIYERQIVAGNEDQGKEHTRHDARHDIHHLVAEAFGQRLGGRQSNDQRYRTEHIEQLHILGIMDVILEVVGDGSILHGEHDERNDAHTGQHDPRLVHE